MIIKAPPWWHKVLVELRDGHTRHISEIYEGVEQTYLDGLRLSDDPPYYVDPDRFKPYSHTGEPKYKKNIQAALVRLTKEGLTERVQRGYYRITEAGQKVLRDASF